METYNDCYLIGFVGECPTETVKKDIWKANLPLSFLSFDNKLTKIEVVLADEAKKSDFMKKKPYEVLWTHGSLQYHGDGTPYLYLKEYATIGLSKSMRSAILRLMGRTGSLVFLKGVRRDGCLFVPRVGQKKNVTDGDLFLVNDASFGSGSCQSSDPVFRGQINSDLSLQKEVNVYDGAE